MFSALFLCLLTKIQGPWVETWNINKASEEEMKQVKTLAPMNID